MRKKDRSTRSLLLEPLENRSLFAVFTYHAWQIDRWADDDGTMIIQVRRIQFESNVADGPGDRGSAKPPMGAGRNAGHHGRNDIDTGLTLEPEGELSPQNPPSHVIRPGLAFNPSTGQLDTGLGARVPVDNGGIHPETTTQINIALTPSLPNSTPKNVSPVVPNIGSTSSRPVDTSSTNTPGLITRPTTPAAPNTVQSPAFVSTPNHGLNAQSGLAPSIAAQSVMTGSVKVESATDSSFSYRDTLTKHSSALELSTSRSNRNAVDQPMLMADFASSVAGREMLEKLLADLAEHHHREQMDSQRTTTTPNDRARYSRASTAAMDAVWGLDGSIPGSIEGGMLGLVINRESSQQDLSEVATDIRNENLAWMASVGVIRSLENGAVATTEYAALTNRLAQLQPPASPSVKWTNEEAAVVDQEEAPTQLHPLLASSSVALGAMLLGLRRVRKSVQLRFTSDRSRSNSQSVDQ